MAATHRYRTSVQWTGSTASGYRAYSREHSVTLAGGPLSVSADAALLGDAGLTNPEQLLLAAAASCQMLSFLALAARAGLDVRSYADDAEALMPATRDRMRITEIVLRPRIVLGPGADRARVAELIETAHHECYIANSISSDIVIDPSVEILDA